jgi:hypothetical protein
MGVIPLENFHENHTVIEVVNDEPEAIEAICLTCHVHLLRYPQDKPAAFTQVPE